MPPNDLELIRTIHESLIRPLDQKIKEQNDYLTEVLRSEISTSLGKTSERVDRLETREAKNEKDICSLQVEAEANRSFRVKLAVVYGAIAFGMLAFFGSIWEWVKAHVGWK